ncbi:hypothetical protein [Prevotella sp. KH2C16]|uniref:hypothetical protein n=1 Tax=Prevotella sp. KH2C16 TaxID=1855325 RepID=UPI000B02B97E|nr:hypothetical protein [Prevotella sp. KH2C16]
MNYDKEIIRILQEVDDEGISIMKIARHVFNACNSLFEPEDFKTVHKDVAKFLARYSKNPDSLIERAKIRGRYRLNMKSGKAQQLMLDFAMDDQREEEESGVDNGSAPSLFE